MIEPLELVGAARKFTLSSSLIHELRTPLNHIIGYAEMLIEDSSRGEADDIVADLQRIRSAGHKLLGLISESFLSSPSIEEPRSVSVPSALERTLTLNIDPTIHDGAALATEASTQKGLLLVVDDNEANRDVLSRLLQRLAYNVETAENGLQALEKLGKGSFDIVLLDIMMPQMDGYEVLERIKADEHLKHVPVIMISALNELDSAVRCIELGADDYLPKPFNPTILKVRIGSCLEKKRSHDREVRDFEELRLSYKRLQELEKLRDDLTHMIIHDLRTPLTSLITGMQTLAIVGELNNDQQEMKDIALSGGETLLGMINDLLDVEKMESGAMQLDYGWIPVDRLVNAATAQVVSLVEEKQLTFVQQVSADVSSIWGDESKLRRTLVNLLGNAVKFTPELGSVSIGAIPGNEAGSVDFWVIDTGEGIPSESISRIFDKFGQVESRQSGRTMSTGLGLTFCKLAVEAHGGHIEVTSVLGQGSTFSFTIPSVVSQTA